MRASHLPFWWRVTPRNWLLERWKPFDCCRSDSTSSSLVICVNGKCNSLYVNMCKVQNVEQLVLSAAL